MNITINTSGSTIREERFVENVVVSYVFKKIATVDAPMGGRIGAITFRHNIISSVVSFSCNGYMNIESHNCRKVVGNDKLSYVFCKNSGYYWEHCINDIIQVDLFCYLVSSKQ